MEKLADKQKEIYDTLVALVKKHPQVRPTEVQLTKLFNTTKQNMNQHLQAMEKKGYIKRVRGLEVVK